MNVDIDDIGKRLQVVTPDGVYNLGAGERLAGMTHQILQQGKLFGGQLDDPPSATCLVPHQVKRQVAHCELGRLIETTITTAQQGIDACEKFLHNERLGQVVI